MSEFLLWFWGNGLFLKAKQQWRLVIFYKCEFSGFIFTDQKSATKPLTGAKVIYRYCLSLLSRCGAGPLLARFQMDFRLTRRERQRVFYRVLPGHPRPLPLDADAFSEWFVSWALPPSDHSFFLAISYDKKPAQSGGRVDCIDRSRRCVEIIGFYRHIGNMCRLTSNRDRWGGFALEAAEQAVDHGIGDLSQRRLGVAGGDAAIGLIRFLP